MVIKVLTHSKNECTMYIAREETMTIEQASNMIERLTEEAKMYADLTEAGLILDVMNVSYPTIFLEEDCGSRKRFRKFFGENETLTQYYMERRNFLAVKYKYGHWEVVFYFSNAEEMLRKVSKGKCKIVAQEVARVEKTIACEV